MTMQDLLPPGEQFPPNMVSMFAGGFVCLKNKDDGATWFVLRGDCDPAYTAPNGQPVVFSKVVISPAVRNPAEFRKWLSAWLGNLMDWIEPPPTIGDLTGDGIVDAADLDEAKKRADEIFLSVYNNLGNGA